MLAAAGVLAGALASAPAHAQRAAADSFANPVVRSIPAGDPWVVRDGGWYYFTATMGPGRGVWVWRARTLTGLDSATKVQVWTAPDSGPTSRQIWAPELHRLGGRWYLYFTASDGVDAHHRVYVLAARTGDPLGRYDPPARVDPTERYAIDPSVLRTPDGRLYFLYCANGVYIAPMADPTRVGGPAVQIVRGTEPWEHGWRDVNGRWEQDAGYWVEAPEPLIHDGRVFLVYSAGHTATPHYYLGLLALASGGDPLDPNAWTKRPEPVFAPYVGPDGAVYTPGHNGFTTSPDGTEDWLVYHGKDGGADASGGNDHSPRTVRAQRFTWGADGAPRFGHPVPSGVWLRKPSGSGATGGPDVRRAPRSVRHAGARTSPSHLSL